MRESFSNPSYMPTEAWVAPKVHVLKIDAKWAEDKVNGKDFEIRVNDRGFRRGDLVTYVVVGKCDHNKLDLPYFRCEVFRIKKVWRDLPGLQDGWCVFREERLVERDCFTEMLRAYALSFKVDLMKHEGEEVSHAG